MREGATATARVIVRFGQVARGRDLHPQVAGVVEAGALEGLGARVMGRKGDNALGS